MNKSNRSPFQNTPYSEQSPTMLFYQQKLSMSRSMPSLRSTRGKSQQQDRIFNFAQTQEKLVARAAPMTTPIHKRRDMQMEEPEDDDQMEEEDQMQDEGGEDEYVHEEAQPEMVAVA